MTRFKDHKGAAKLLKQIDENKSDYLIIHYACESFFDTNGRTPHVTSIAVKKFDDGQAELFAIHKIAEIKHVPIEKITAEYDNLEKEMLRRFFDYVKIHIEQKWIHWNMRDSNYGFKALEQRYLVLGGTPTVIPDSNKVDLSRLFIHLYGKGYIDNPRIQSLLKFNNIKPLNFLDGKQEAKAFNDHNYVELSFSTASKVDIFANFLTQSIDKKLKVKSKRSEIYGNSMLGWYDFIAEKPYGKPLIWIIGVLISGIIGAELGHIF
ncbi:hypothetical protein [Loigolactobacillus jiayinensis]|uniref:Uncharacterized protein n=1 Tax=Loigolactobacillus jiayinensis TaxID=2486016 RepID=A0ABW1RH38_9LACO|nr:hypothetical protein [Loigolactobacillus jiayinensis]